MSFGALGAKLASIKQQKPTKKCERCNLYYPEDEDKCIHCGEFSNSELEQFIARLEEEKTSSKNLGTLFFYIAILITLAMLILLL